MFDTALRLLAALLLVCCGASAAAALSHVPAPHIGADTLIEAQSGALHTNKWRHPKDAYSEFTRLSPKDCAQYPAARHPDCAMLDSGSDDLGDPDYFSDAHSDPGVPVTRRSYPARRVEPETVPLRRDAGRPVLGRHEDPLLDDRYLRTVAGQLLLMTFEGQSPPQAGLVRIIDRLKAFEAAGVLVRAENVVSSSQLKTLSDLLSDANDRKPLIIIERPGSSSLTSAAKPGFSLFPSPRELGDKGDALDAFNAYQRMAKELAASGISMNIGPVIDVCRPESRRDRNLCYGEEPSHAAAFASAFNFAHRDQKVLTALRFDAEDGGESSRQVFDLMLARMPPDALVIDLDAAAGGISERTAEAQRDFRRAGFGGVIIHTRSDPLSPGETAEALVRTLGSGADMLLFTPAPGWSIRPVVEVLELAADSGRISQSRLREAFETVYRMNWRRRQWQSETAATASDATSSIYSRPVR